MGKDLVVKQNDLINIESKYHFSEMELKLINNLVAFVDKDDEDFEDKMINVSDLAIFNKKNQNHNYIKVACEDLMSKPFYIPGTTKLVNWFSMIDYGMDGIIEYRIDKALKKYLLQIKETDRFTSYYLKNILNLKGAYNIRIYELLKQFQPNNNKSSGFRKIKIEDFKRILKIPKSYNVSNLENRILKKAQKDLSENTDIDFTYTFTKRGRKIDLITFTIKLKKQKEEIIKIEDENGNYKIKNLKNVCKNLRC